MKSELPVSARQFGLIDVFAAMTLAALLIAMLAPFLRELDGEHRNKLVALAVIQFLLVTGTVVVSMSQRQRLLRKAGRRLGTAFYGTMRWRRWPLVKSILCMLFLGLAQIAIAWAISSFPFPPPAMQLPVFFVYEMQIATVFGYAVSRYMWRVYPSSLEIFEKGIVMAGVRLHDWSHVELRPSQFFEDRIAIVLRPDGNFGADTKMAVVTPTLREQAFAAAQAESTSESESPT